MPPNHALQRTSVGDSVFVSEIIMIPRVNAFVELLFPFSPFFCLLFLPFGRDKFRLFDFVVLAHNASSRIFLKFGGSKVGGLTTF